MAFGFLSQAGFRTAVSFCLWAVLAAPGTRFGGPVQTQWDGAGNCRSGLNRQQWNQLKAFLSPFSHHSYFQEIELDGGGRVQRSKLRLMPPEIESNSEAGQNDFILPRPRQLVEAPHSDEEGGSTQGIALLPLQISVAQPILIQEGKRGVLISVILVNPAAFDPGQCRPNRCSVNTQLISDLGSQSNFATEFYEGETPWVVDTAWQELRIFIRAEAVAKLAAQGIAVHHILQLGYGLQIGTVPRQVKRFYSRSSSPIEFLPNTLPAPALRQMPGNRP